MAKPLISRIGAAVDVGSNSVHLLVAGAAEAGPHAGQVMSVRSALSVLHDRSELLGLGDAVDAHGEVPHESIERLLRALIEYRELAEQAGADFLVAIATEPLRRAANADRVAAAVLDATRLALRVISVRQEAELTFIGVTRGQPPPWPLIVVDIGGGSTEIGVYAPGAELDIAALPIGSGRLTRLVIEHDPPTNAELDQLRQVAAGIRGQLPVRPPHAGSEHPRAVFVGGTATNIARLGRLTRDGLAADRRTIARMPSAAISQMFGVRPQRARQLAAGAAIVEVLLDHYGLDEAQVSTASLRDGAIIAGLRFGDEWLERLGQLISTTRGRR